MKDEKAGYDERRKVDEAFRPVDGTRSGKSGIEMNGESGRRGR